MPLPSYAALAPNYPVDPDPDAVKAAIGGSVNADWITNTCVIRISKAFNYAGDNFLIPEGDDGLLTVRGADTLNYALRVEEFIAFLRSRYGEPQVVSTGNSISIEPFSGERGIIAWHVSGWQDATGHFTLWNDDAGLYVGDHDYFAFPTSPPAAPGPWLTKAELWRC